MIIIGEKLNGAIPAVAKAIAAHDGEFIRQRALAQAQAAQDEDYFEEPVPLYIDVCASTDPAVEVETLKWMIEEVEAAIPEELEHVAIAVDSPSAAVCAEAFKFCKRPGIVNSVSMEKDADGVVKTDIVFPAIADTDWGCIALLCESGIPKSVEDRMQVFEKIMAKASVLSSAELEKFGSLEQIESDRDSVKTAEDALKFIQAYQGVLRCQ